MANDGWEECSSDLGIWKPKVKGDKVEGEVTAIRQGVYGLEVDVKNEVGVSFKLPSHKALQTRIRNVQVGDKLRIEFLGQDLPKIKGQQGTMLYKVERKAKFGEEQVVV